MEKDCPCVLNIHSSGIQICIFTSMSLVFKTMTGSSNRPNFCLEGRAWLCRINRQLTNFLKIQRNCLLADLFSLKSSYHQLQLAAQLCNYSKFLYFPNRNHSYKIVYRLYCHKNLRHLHSFIYIWFKAIMAL